MSGALSEKLAVEISMNFAMNQIIKNKKEIGAFYTPSDVTKVLSDWAIRMPDEFILEPSFGGCGFLEASKNRLKQLGNDRFIEQIFGCDIDQRAFEHLEKKLGLTTSNNRFILGDFLEIFPENFITQRFDVVLGNPPYISHHNMSAKQKFAVSRVMEYSGLKLSSKASLWAYFLIHGMHFLRDGGRMAWVLPGSFLSTEYGLSLHSILINNFERVASIVLNERIFLIEGAEERSIILLCENKGTKSKHGISLHSAESVSVLDKIIKSKQLNSSRNEFSGRASYNLLEPDEKRVLDSLFNHPYVKYFGELATIRIGLVTGNNNFFIMNEADAKRFNLTEAMLQPIVPKFRLISGISFTKSDIDREVKSGKKCLLLDTTRMRKNSTSLINYLKTYPEQQLVANKTFAKRNPWHKIDDGKIPDAFMSYMQHNGPQIALNFAGANCTNSVHRIYFNQVNNCDQKMAAVSFLSTLTQLSAEIEGRSYGSGVLKQEPSEAKRIKVCLPVNLNGKMIDELYDCVDKMIRSGENERARKKVDSVIFNFLKISSETAAFLEKVLSRLRNFRQR